MKSKNGEFLTMLNGYCLQIVFKVLQVKLLSYFSAKYLLSNE